MKEILQNAIDFVLSVVGDWGYVGIFVMMFLESSFFPFPSEVVMIPAGYLVYQGQMNAILAFVCGVLGSVAGALLNYFIAYKMGRAFILRYGRYVFFTPKTMEKMEEFFAKHGHISTFIGRLVPVVRQYISLPAGLCKMDLVKFCLFTGLGAGIWVGILMWIGYGLGGIFDGLDSRHLFDEGVKEWITSGVNRWTFGICIGVGVLLVGYIWKHRKR